MNFLADKQTLNDLNLIGKFKQHSIFSLFNKTKTRGGETLLDNMFRKPMTDPAAINQRSDLIRFFQSKQLKLQFRQDSFTVVENYLSSVTSGNRLAAMTNTLAKKAMSAIAKDEKYKILENELIETIDALNHLKDLVIQLPEVDMVSRANSILKDERLAWLATERAATGFPVVKMEKYDWLLRHTLRDEMEVLLTCIYDLDVFIALSDVARERGLCYALAFPGDGHFLHASGIRHLAIQKAVGNPLELDQQTNMLFLTGANMAGKSTFMKSVGIAIYLAHMGFPVACDSMEFSVLDGLYTSINVPDNIELGYSHFYAEVLRVKQAALSVASGQNMLVIFDELFKGTNVKDAYDATLAVTSSFSKYRNCHFIISTHIIEVGEALAIDHGNLRFSYLPTIMEGAVPRYPYQLSPGITSDRHGMIIIENEKIVDIINSEKIINQPDHV